MSEFTEQTELRNESKDSKSNENIKNTGDKKMEKQNKVANVKLTDIDDLLEENIVPNQNIIAQYNRKKTEAKKLKIRLERLMEEIKTLGNKIKGIGQA